MAAEPEHTAALKREGLAATLYFAFYLGYLFVRPENELLHWLTLVLIPLLLLGAHRKVRGDRGFRDTLASVGLKTGNLTAGLLPAAGLGIALSVLQLWISDRSEEILPILRSGRLLFLFPMVLVLLLTAGFTEELFFRGVLQTRLRALLRSRGAAVLATAVLFGVYHIPYAYLLWPTQGNWSGALAAALGQGIPAGILLGIVYHASRGNLLAPVLLHSLINALPAMTMIKIQSG